VIGRIVRDAMDRLVHSRRVGYTRYPGLRMLQTSSIDQRRYTL
jgi:hypothetical protein